MDVSCSSMECGVFFFLFIFLFCGCDFDWIRFFVFFCAFAFEIERRLWFVETGNLLHKHCSMKLIIATC